MFSFLDEPFRSAESLLRDTVMSVADLDRRFNHDTARMNKNLCRILNSYGEDRKFRDSVERAFVELNPFAPAPTRQEERNEEESPI
jgi:hypothetical protein